MRNSSPPTCERPAGEQPAGERAVRIEGYAESAGAITRQAQARPVVAGGHPGAEVRAEAWRRVRHSGGRLAQPHEAAPFAWQTR